MTASSVKADAVSWRTYLSITKPGIIRGNLISASAGYFLVAQNSFHLETFLALIAGTSCIIAAACVCNNIIDRDIDVLMERTAGRATAQGVVSPRTATTFAALLLVAGVSILSIGTNSLTVLVGLIGFIAYVAVYTPLKRRTLYATHVGSISGAMPPVAGYVAASNHFGVTAVLLCSWMAAWQMAHFFGISLFRLSDYRSARVPVMPAVKGVTRTKYAVLRYIVVLAAVSILLTVVGHASISFMIISLALCAWWLKIGMRGFDKTGKVWGKQIFLFSLLVLSLQSVLLMIDRVLP